MKDAISIVACASPHGRSARAVIRVFGAGAAAVFSQLTGEDARARALLRVRIRLGSAELPALALWYQAGASYSGDPGFELEIPGNPTLVERVIARLLAFAGVRGAEPGEFTARALFAGRLSLAQAEGVGALVAAQNAEQLRAARLALEGKTGRAFVTWADELATLSALVEAGIDFTDQEDVVAIAPRELRARLVSLRSQISAHLGAEEGAEARGTRVRVVIFGKPNAGKSTLFNALLGRTRAVTSPVAGSTRDVIEEELILPGVGAVSLIDLAGLDDSAAGASAAGAQHAARGALADADVALWCDPSGEFSYTDSAGAPARLIRVRTFADQPGVRSADLTVCALDGFGLDALRRAVTDAAWGAAAGTGARSGVLPRQRRVMMQTRSAIDGALATVEDERLREPELTAELLREALGHAGELVGRVGVEELLGRVFATFCVGK